MAVEVIRISLHNTAWNIDLLEEIPFWGQVRSCLEIMLVFPYKNLHDRSHIPSPGPGVPLSCTF